VSGRTYASDTNRANLSCNGEGEHHATGPKRARGIGAPSGGAAAPLATATYCRPSTSYDITDAPTFAPVWKLQRRSPHTRIRRTIQSVAASKWFGQMEPRELYEIAPSLGLSPEERDRIEKAGQGEGLLVTSVGEPAWPHIGGRIRDGQY